MNKKPRKSIRLQRNVRVVTLVPSVKKHTLCHLSSDEVNHNYNNTVKIEIKMAATALLTLD